MKGISIKRCIEIEIATLNCKSETIKCLDIGWGDVAMFRLFRGGSLYLQGLLFLLMTLIGLWLLQSPAMAEERNFHRICVKGTPSIADAGPCIPAENFVQRRDQCGPGSNKPCFGVASDGWITDLIADGKCGAGNPVPCIPMPFRYATIEYKTNGMSSAVRWQKEQVRQIVKEIKTSRKIFVVTFVHGWHHDAREIIGEEFQEKDLIGEYRNKSPHPAEITQDRNLIFFKHILAKARWELNRIGKSDYKVLGVYVGWDGGPADAYINAGDRALAANRIGLSDDFNQDMKALSDAVTSAGNHDPGNRMLLIGHSFGGRIVSRFMLRNALGTERDLWPLGPHNLTVTLNPAISADAFDAYMRLPTAEGLPGWINITSKDDWATGKVFRIGSTLGELALIGIGLNDTLFSPARGMAVGHYARYQTHRLSVTYEATRGTIAPIKYRKTCGNVSYPDERRPTNWFRFPNDATTTVCRSMCNAYSFRSRRCGDDGYLSVFSRNNKFGEPGARVPGNMWNISTDKDVIGGDEVYSLESAIEHNAFVQTNLIRMLIEFAFQH